MAEVRISFTNCHYTLWWQYKIQENNMLRYISHLQNINICAFLQIGNTSGRFLLNRQSQEIKSHELPRIYFYYQLSYPCPLVIGVDGQPLAAFKFFCKLCYDFSSSHQVLWLLSGIVGYLLKVCIQNLFWPKFHHNGIMYIIFDTENILVRTSLNKNRPFDKYKD